MFAVLEKTLDDVRGAWRFRWIAVGAAAVLALIGWAVVFTLPDRYEAGARIFVDTRTALKPVLQGLTVEQDVDAQLNFVRQSLLEGPQLAKIAVASGVLPDSITDEGQRARILDSLSRRVEIAVSSASAHQDERNSGTIYTIDYRDSDRARSLRVVELLLSTFVEETLGGKRRGSESAQKFLETQIHDYEQRLRTAEDRLAAFKKANVGLLPSEEGGYFAQLQGELDAIQKTQTQLAIAESRASELTRQLHGDAAVTAASTVAPATAGGPGAANAAGDTLSRIQEAQGHIDELLLRYTEKHPDVVAAKAELEELKARRAAELASLRRGDLGAVSSSGAGASPVYQSIQLELNKVGVEIAALRGELALHQTKAAQLKQRLDTAPQVEAQYQQLTRDHDVNKAQYEAMLANYQKARLGEQADDAGSVRFSIVLPPTASFVPVWPQRTLCLIAVWIAALVAGGGLAYALNRLRPVVVSVRGLTELTNLPVLGLVSAAFPSRQGAAVRRSILGFSAAMCVLVIGLGSVLVLSEIGMRMSIQALTAWMRA
jgi:polysaccharide chain length determinant protein (PEP-CTERM system associated)